MMLQQEAAAPEESKAPYINHGNAEPNPPTSPLLAQTEEVVGMDTPTKMAVLLRPQIP